MNSARFELDPEVSLDARHAAWFPRERVLAVADLHLGYAWAHRLSGQLMPVTPQDDTLARLRELQKEYEPRGIVVLGDIVHRAMALPALIGELRALVEELSARSRLTLLAGNHDRALGQVLEDSRLPVKLESSARVGGTLLVHGDGDDAAAPGEPPEFPARAKRVMMGHEHPAISIGDGVTTSTKCPCFLVGERVIVLPAFSRWAAGTCIGAYPFMSRLAREAVFEQAVAICGNRLLPVRLPG